MAKSAKFNKVNLKQTQRITPLKTATYDPNYTNPYSILTLEESFPFFELPRELRDKIYALALTPDRGPMKITIPATRASVRHEATQRNIRSLRLTSKQVREEALDVFFKHTIFDFAGQGALKDGRVSKHAFLRIGRALFQTEVWVPHACEGSVGQHVKVLAYLKLRSETKWFEARLYIGAGHENLSFEDWQSVDRLLLEMEQKAIQAVGEILCTAIDSDEEDMCMPWKVWTAINDSCWDAYVIED